MSQDKKQSGHSAIKLLRLRQEDPEFEINLGYCSKTINRKKEGGRERERKKGMGGVGGSGSSRQRGNYSQGILKTKKLKIQKMI